MIEESEADDAHKRIVTSKLDALLGLCETASCRRVQLLAYFGEASRPCGNCDTCLEAPATGDGTREAQMALSCVYRVERMSGFYFGAGHLIDILRGNLTERVKQTTWTRPAFNFRHWRYAYRNPMAPHFSPTHRLWLVNG